MATYTASAWNPTDTDYYPWQLHLEDGSCCTVNDLLDNDFAELEESLQQAVVAELQGAASRGLVNLVTREQVNSIRP